jgi:hypothetical protein
VFAILLTYVLINGGLWVYWTNAHSKEKTQYKELKPWLQTTNQKLKDLEHQADSTTSQDTLDKIQAKYDLLLKKYNTNVDKYNHDADVLSHEFYLIPQPRK